MNFDTSRKKIIFLTFVSYRYCLTWQMSAKIFLFFAKYAESLFCHLNPLSARYNQRHTVYISQFLSTRKMSCPTCSKVLFCGVLCVFE